MFCFPVVHLKGVFIHSCVVVHFAVGVIWVVVTLFSNICFYFMFCFCFRLWVCFCFVFFVCFCFMFFVCFCFIFFVCFCFMFFVCFCWSIWVFVRRWCTLLESFYCFSFSVMSLPTMAIAPFLTMSRELLLLLWNVRMRKSMAEVEMDGLNGYI